LEGVGTSSREDFFVTVQNKIMNAVGGYDVHTFTIVNIHEHWIIMDGKTLMGSHTENNNHPDIPLGFSLAHVAYYLATSECGDHLLQKFGGEWALGSIESLFLFTTRNSFWKPVDELHRFSLNEGHIIRAPSPLFTALELSRPARPNAETAGYNMVEPGMRYFKIDLVLDGTAYRRIELRRKRTKEDTRITYKFEQVGEEVTIGVMRFWYMPRDPPVDDGGARGDESDDDDGVDESKSDGAEQLNADLGETKCA
jgi:hypothetical protein